MCHNRQRSLSLASRLGTTGMHLPWVFSCAIPSVIFRCLHFFTNALFAVKRGSKFGLFTNFQVASPNGWRAINPSCCVRAENGDPLTSKVSSLMCLKYGTKSSTFWFSMKDLNLSYSLNALTQKSASYWSWNHCRWALWNTNASKAGPAFPYFAVIKCLNSGILEHMYFTHLVYSWRWGCAVLIKDPKKSWNPSICILDSLKVAGVYALVLVMVFTSMYKIINSFSNIKRLDWLSWWKATVIAAAFADIVPGGTTVVMLMTSARSQGDIPIKFTSWMYFWKPTCVHNGLWLLSDATRVTFSWIIWWEVWCFLVLAIWTNISGRLSSLTDAVVYNNCRYASGVRKSLTGFGFFAASCCSSSLFSDASCYAWNAPMVSTSTCILGVATGGGAFTSPWRLCSRNWRMWLSSALSINKFSPTIFYKTKGNPVVVNVQATRRKSTRNSHWVIKPLSFMTR